MATLALTAVGSAAGSALLPSGLSFLGTPSPAPPSASSSAPRRLADRPGAVRRHRSRHAPSMARASPICASPHRPKARRSRASTAARASAARSSGRPPSKRRPSTRAASAAARARAPARPHPAPTIAYFANFADRAVRRRDHRARPRLGRRPRDRHLRHHHRLYPGTDTQDPDPLIEAKQGGDAPAYRGLAYIVFEHLPLADIRQSHPAAVVRSRARRRHAGARPQRRRADPRLRRIRLRTRRRSTAKSAASPASSENVHTKLGGTDWSVSLDQLQSAPAQRDSVSLVVSWFGDDLRAGTLPAAPAASRAPTRSPRPLEWSVAGLDARHRRHRLAASTAAPPTAARRPTRPSSTPSAICKARGLSVVFSPFILMDVPAGNTLPDPYSAAATQAAYPWRGRITVSPAAGRPGTPDKTAAAATQLASFIGTAQPSHFSLAGDTVVYSGPRRVDLPPLHPALRASSPKPPAASTPSCSARSCAASPPCAAAPTPIRSSPRSCSSPPTCAPSSARRPRSSTPPTGPSTSATSPPTAAATSSSISIRCGPRRTSTPSASTSIGRSPTGATATPISMRSRGVPGIHDLAYLKANLAAGEGFDWYYASDADRAAQVRTPITDGAGKPWVFRYKDIKSWWSNPHFNRPGGIESTTPTAWVPQSKPFWFMEIGCPAIDKGANQPNVFIDPKSSEIASPAFLVRRPRRPHAAPPAAGLRRGLRSRAPRHVAGANPVSSVYGGRMVDAVAHPRLLLGCAALSRISQSTSRSGATPPTGRSAIGSTAASTSAPVPALVATLLADYGFTDFDATRLPAPPPASSSTASCSAREALQPLELAFFFDSLESDGRIVFRPRGAAPTALTLTPDDLVETRADSRFCASRARRKPTCLPPPRSPTSRRPATIRKPSPKRATPSRRLGSRRPGRTRPRARSERRRRDRRELAVRSLGRARARRRSPCRQAASRSSPATRHARHQRRDAHSCASPRSAITARATSKPAASTQSIYAARSARPRDVAGAKTASRRRTARHLSRLPACRNRSAARRPSSPPRRSPGPARSPSIRSPETSGYTLSTLLPRAATTGLTTVAPSPPARTAASIRAIDAHLSHSIAARSPPSRRSRSSPAPTPPPSKSRPTSGKSCSSRPRHWSRRAPIGCSDLLRGQRGTEHVLTDRSVAAGARFVLLDDAVQPLDHARPTMSACTLNWRAGPARRDIGDSQPTRRRPTPSPAKASRPRSRPHPRHTQHRRRSHVDLGSPHAHRRRQLGQPRRPPRRDDAKATPSTSLHGATVKRTLTTTSPTAIYPPPTRSPTSAARKHHLHPPRPTQPHLRPRHRARARRLNFCTLSRSFTGRGDLPAASHL